MNLISGQEIPPRIPIGISEYLHRGFHRGTAIRPYVLRLPYPVNRLPNELVITVSFPTLNNIRWTENGVTLPTRWIKNTLNSGNVLPFRLNQVYNQQVIIPVDEDGNLLHNDQAMQNQQWQELNGIYLNIFPNEYPPPSLIGCLNQASGLHFQLPINQPHLGAGLPPLERVLYSAEGSRMKACRILSGTSIVREGLFHLTCGSADEAAYLVAFLNAPILRRVINERRPTRRYYGLHPWRTIPIPVFNWNNPDHRRLVDLSIQAEAHALDIPNNQEMANLIMERLDVQGISAEIDGIVRTLLG